MLGREVEALLHAHDRAGTFLDAPIRICTQAAPATGPDHGTANLSAAAHAEAFLRGAAGSPHPTLDAYLAALPTTIQREARERIEAGLRVRQWLKDTQGMPQHQAEDRDEAPPQLPGFRWIDSPSIYPSSRKPGYYGNWSARSRSRTPGAWSIVI